MKCSHLFDIINLSEDKNEDIIRLLPKRKKGLLRIVFSRFFVMSLLILLQIILTLSFTTWLYTQFSLIYAIDRAFAFLVIFYLFKCEMDSTAKLTWLLILAVTHYRSYPAAIHKARIRSQPYPETRP